MKHHTICILLCQFNGARFLEQQLRSIDTAAFASAHVMVSDDGSTDDSLAIAKRVLSTKNLSFEALEGPRHGFAENFRSAIAAAGDTFDFYAFCDQDDVWHADKLPVAAAAILQHPAGLPVLYGSRTRMTAENGEVIGLSPLFARPPSFNNALVQSIAGGNTMVMNRAAFVLLKRASANVRFVSHDWFAYQMITGAGGVLIMDQTPHIDYCQHGNNAVGSNKGIRAGFKRLQAALAGRFSSWNNVQLGALHANRTLLTQKACAILDAYAQARQASFFVRLRALHQFGVYRQTLKGTLSLWAACLLKRL
jgi:glycosyltransferase involved in cell wall biosynthesis